MLWLRSATCAAFVAALILVPATGHATSGADHPGSSCGHPFTWHFNGGDFGAPEGTLTHGPVRAWRVYPNGVDGVSVTASRPWRICRFRGTYANGNTWDLPGTLGDAHHRSHAGRLFASNQLAELVVSYARRTSSDGSTCSAPRVVVYGSGGDAGAHLRAVFEGNVSRGRYVAHWDLGAGSTLCFVRGWAFSGTPFTVRSGADGSHPMEPFRSHGNHDLPLAYLVLAFRR